MIKPTDLPFSYESFELLKEHYEKLKSENRILSRSCMELLEYINIESIPAVLNRVPNIDETGLMVA